MSHHIPDRVLAHELAATFKDLGVAEAYQHRAPYPAQTFDILERLITDAPRTVLDIGTGQGSLARPLAARADQVDALDVSETMLAVGAQEPGGRRPNLRWILGAAETAALAGPYALVTAGCCLHWMSWPRTMARLAAAMTDHAVLAILDRSYQDSPWSEELGGIIARHSRNPDYDAEFSVGDELAARGLWQITGRATTSVISFRQPVAAYIEHFHSTSALARKWMAARESAEFGRAIEEIVAPYAEDGTLELAVAADIVWGRPTPAGQS